MTDARFSTAASARGLRVGVVSVLVLLAFLIGLLVAWAMIRQRMAREAQGPAAALVQPGSAAPAAAPTPVPAPTPIVTDPATLSAREAVLSDQLAALEARTASITVTAAAAGGQATRAEALLTALAARRALDRGLPLGALDAQLQARFGATRARAVQIVQIAARQPVTLEDLRQALDAIGPSVTAGMNGGWWATVRRELGTLVVIRRAGMPSPRPADHLARARRLLEAGQVEAAQAEVAQLPGAGEAQGWLAAAHRYILARQALDVLENTALTMPAPVTPPASVPPAAL